MGIDRLRLIYSHVFLFCRSVIHLHHVKPPILHEKISRESVFEVIAFRLWYISYWPYNMAILQMAYILFTELTGEIGSNQND